MGEEQKVKLVGFSPNKFLEAFLKIRSEAEGKKEQYKVIERKDA